MCTPKLFALLLTIAMVMGVAENAYALNVGQQGTPQNINTALQNEGQRGVASAVYAINTNDPAKIKILSVKFTMNAQGAGCILFSDNKDETKATKKYVYGKIANGRIYDPREKSTKIPENILPKTSEQDALQKCKLLVDGGKLNECRILASSLRKGIANGDRIMIHGDLIIKQKDGSEKANGKVTAVADFRDSSDNSLTLLYSDDDGITIINRVFIDTQFEPNALSIIHN